MSDTSKPKKQRSVKPKQKSSVRHTRAIQRDRTKRPAMQAPDETVTARLQEIIHPATLAQVAHFHQLGLRERVLTLPVMMAFVLSLIWRQLGSVAETVRVLTRDGLLWCPKTRVSKQAVEQRLNSMPAHLFERVLQDLLPIMADRWAQRTRPLPPALTWAKERFSSVSAVDGSTLDGLLRKIGLLRECAQTPLAGRMLATLDVISRLPQQVWYDENPKAHDQRFWPQILASLKPNSLLIFDMGFLNFARFDAITQAGSWFLTRQPENVVTQTQQTLRKTDILHDTIVRVGSSESSQCATPLRQVQWHYRGKWYCYLTNVVDPAMLPAEYVVALYWQRWRIEDSFNVIKRLLGLASFWGGSINSVMTQLWATWILYAVLVDLTDAVAETLQKPFQALSMEMVYRGLSHYTTARQRGEADDPVAYLAADAQGLGIIKQERKNRSPITNLLYLTIPDTS
ncbi:MAG: IS4 family transposase [Candidatus Viridilinea halotolerans]|uniref:IS4 family transposase n=1 Tax=Candidatus Viridilinea halotolerans TaxID=2491704 RepID=A0A426TQ63_9CHLR|nr:MAG: IS4 family transposase [Candidatus Viridilinea halotolerans]